MVRASDQDTSRTPPLGVVPGTYVWVKAPGRALTCWRNLHSLPSLEASWGPPGRAGKL